jgi:2-oxopent-4-enoate/cis-2-oxohex-4-enoate hydratase
VPVELSALADELAMARRDRRPVAPLTGRPAGLHLDDAYEVQRLGLEARLDAGERLLGGKLGFTSRAMQRAMGVSAPNSGWLTDTMTVHDGVVRLDELIHPKVEPEIAFLLGADLAPPVTAADVLAATAAVLPCLEVVDSRFVDFRFAAADNVADDSSAGALVLGDGVAPGEIDLALVGATLWVDEVPHATAAGAAVLDHPAAAVAWMVDHARRPDGDHDDGVVLRAGEVVISGGLTAPVTLTAGMHVRAVVDRVGTVELRAA